MNHPPIPISELAEHTELLKANDNLKLSQEYEVSGVRGERLTSGLLGDDSCLIVLSSEGNGFLGNCRPVWPLAVDSTGAIMECQFLAFALTSLQIYKRGQCSEARQLSLFYFLFF